MSGYIKLYRATCDHPLFKRDMAYLGAWAWLLSKAAWKPHEAKHRKTITYELQVGDLPGGRAYLADQWGWTEKKVRTFLECLARHNMVSISQLKGQRLAIITICNYSKFQHVEILGGQQRAEEGPTKGHTEEGKELKEEDTTLTHASTPEPKPVRKPIPEQSDLEAMTAALTKAAGKALNPTSASLMMIADPLNWIQAGADFDLDILPAVCVAAQKCRPGSIHGWNYFAGAVKDAMHRRIETGKSFAEAPARIERIGRYEPPSDAAVLAAMTRQPLPPKLTPAMD